MSRRTASALLCVLSAFCLQVAFATCADIRTKFVGGGSDGAPLGWVKHGYVHYRPFATTAFEDGGRTLHVSNVVGRSGCGLMPEKRLSVRGGEVITFDCDLKGRGSLNVFLTHYGKDGKNVRIDGAGSQQRVALSGNWKHERFVLNVQDGDIPTESVVVIFEFSKGADAYVRDLSADVLRVLRSGNFEYNPIWTFLSDDFESVGRKRVGNPRILNAEHTGGLTVQSKVAQFTATDGKAKVICAGHCPIQGKGRFLRISYRIFDIAEKTGLALCLKKGEAKAFYPIPKEAKRLSLPVECVFRCGEEGEWTWDFRSLTDGGRFHVSGTDALFEGTCEDLSVRLALTGQNGQASVTIDDFVVGEDRAVVRSRELPKPYVPPKSFDPRKAGWRQVFADEFDAASGTPYDRTKWFIPDYYGYTDNGRVRHDGKGHLEIVVDYDKKTDKLEAMDLWTRDAWTYGYFEARVRFTRNHGFWAAFWMYSLSHLCASEDGVEIDCFEDYGIRRAQERGDEGIYLDHAMHANYQRMMKSFGKHSRVPGSLDEFHTVGCLRTPLGVSIYLDGQLAGNITDGYDQSTSTFDAFRQNLVSTPLHMVVSACVIGSWRGKDHPEVMFPESYLVDWVRAYEMPTAELPQLSWKQDDRRMVVAEGERLRLEPVIRSAAPVKAVYLFDDGAYLAMSTNAPWAFDLPFSADGYRSTCFMSVGSQGTKPDFGQTIHSFTAFAVDDKGRVGLFEGDPRRVFTPAALQNAKGPKIVQQVPGAVAVGEKPSDFVSRVQTGTIRVVELDVTETGDYEASFEYVSGSDTRNRILIAIDGALEASVSCPGRVNEWKRDGSRKSCRLRLTKGRHKLMLTVIGYVSFGPFTIERL